MLSTPHPPPPRPLIQRRRQRALLIVVVCPSRLQIIGEAMAERYEDMVTKTGDAAKLDAELTVEERNRRGYTPRPNWADGSIQR